MKSQISACLLTLAILAGGTGFASAATTPATTTPAATTAPAAATPAVKAAPKVRSPKSIECSKQADAKSLHGKERKAFRAECMKAA